MLSYGLVPHLLYNIVKYYCIIITINNNILKYGLIGGLNIISIFAWISDVLLLRINIPVLSVVDGLL